MRRASLDEILVFTAVVRAGSFVGGGQALGLTRSAAAKAVARLEQGLGVRLLNRTTRTLGLTDEGRTFHDHCQLVLAALDDAEASVGEPTGTPRGVLRLNLPDAFGRIAILPLLSRYLDAWPDVQVEVSFTDQVTDLIEGGFDLAVRIGAATADSRFIARTIREDRAILGAAPAYLAARGVPETIEQLSGHDCLIFRSRALRQGWWMREGTAPWVRAEGRSRLRMDSGEAIRDAAVAGLGIALLPGFLAAPDLARGRLVQLLPDCETETVRILAIYPSKQYLPAKVRRFIDLLVQALSSRPDSGGG